MSRYVLYAYVDGYDLATLAADLESEFLRFLEDRRWLHGKAWVVNQRQESAQSGADLPRWDLGINLELPDSKDEPRDWFTDVEAISEFLRGVSGRIQREFVVGVADTTSSYTWDIAFIDGDPINLDRIAKALGVATHNEGAPYSREELESVLHERPARGPVCPKCGCHIPQFADLKSADETRVRHLILAGQTVMAIHELRAATGCSVSWAKLWVQHSGRPDVVGTTAPCPYCGKPLKTARARQCPHCAMDWHDPENPRLLKKA